MYTYNELFLSSQVLFGHFLQNTHNRHPIGHVTLVAIPETTILMPYL